MQCPRQVSSLILNQFGLGAALTSLRASVFASLLTFLAALVSLVGLTGCEQQPTDEALSISGESVRLAGSDWLVVNYWAEWCGPCRHEIPELNELDSQPLTNGDAKGGPQVVVLGVNYDGLKDQKLAEVSERMGIEFAVLAEDPRLLWGQESPTVLPSTYIIAPGGDFIETLVGPQTRAGILSRIETLAAQRSDS